MPDYIAVVTARAGSVRLPNKNMLPLGGMPLAMRSVHHALAAGLECIVTTDIPELLALASQAGATIVRRPAELATSDCNHMDAIVHALESTGNSDKNVVLLQPTTPFREDCVIEDCIDQHRNECGTVMTVDGKGRENGCVYVFTAGNFYIRDCNVFKTTHKNSLEIDCQQDYVDACRMETFQHEMPLVLPEFMEAVRDRVSFDRMTLVARGGVPTPQDTPACYVNHCRGYEGGRADVLVVVATDNIKKVGVNPELIAVAEKADLVIIRDHGQVEWLLNNLQFKVKPVIVRLTPAKWVDGVTTGVWAKWIFQSLGVQVILSGFSGPASRAFEIKEHVPYMDKDIAYLTS